MNNFKKISKVFCLILLSIFASCSEDVYEIGSHTSESKFKSEKGSYSNFQIEGLAKKMKIRNIAFNPNLKTENEDGFYFTIDTTSVLHLFNSEVESFTLKVKNSDTPLNSFQNLVLKKTATNVLTAYLITYYPNVQYKNELLEHGSAAFSGSAVIRKLDPENIHYTNQSCTTISVNLCDVGNNGTHIAYGSQCLPYTVSGTSCDDAIIDAPGGGGGLNGGGNYSGGGSDGGAGWGSGTGNLLFNVPTRAEPPYIDVTNLIGEEMNQRYNYLLLNLKLSKTQEQWLGLDIAKINNLYDFLNQNGLTAENINFVKKMINLAVSNNSNFTLDNTITNTNPLNFSNVAEFQNFLDSRSNLGTDFNYTLQQNEKIASTKFWIGFPFAGVKTNIKQNMTAPYSVNGVTTELFGITIFLDFHQSDYSVNVLGNVVTVDVLGVASVKVFVENIGTVYHENQHFQIKINKNTGEIISAIKIGI